MLSSNLWEQIRRLHNRRLAQCFIKALFKDPFKIFIACKGQFYKSSYDVLYPAIFNYDGYVAMVAADEDQEDIFIAKLESINGDQYIYRAHEISRAYTRIPNRIIKININSAIICFLVPCYKK